MSNFTNKKVLITGGSTGIGFFTAQAFIAAGAQVTITGTNPDNLSKAAVEINSNQLTTVQSNTTDLAAIEQLVSGIKGGIDVLFINAGIAQFGGVADTPEALFDSVLNVNFKGAYFTLQKAIPFLNEGASVVLLSSINASVAMGNTSVYGASKAALNALGRISAVELAPKRIRVNIVSPGPIETPIFGKLGMPQEALNDFANAMIGKLPLGRFGKPEEVAALVLFLSGPDAQFITGSEFVIDGGASLHQVL